MCDNPSERVKGHRGTKVRSGERLLGGRGARVLLHGKEQIETPLEANVEQRCELKHG